MKSPGRLGSDLYRDGDGEWHGALVKARCTNGVEVGVEEERVCRG